MRSSKPPVLATWLVEHLIPGPRNEALAGDLLEQFSQGRSVTWYWRQVLCAVLWGLVKDWRVLALAIAVTAGWAYPLNFWDTPMTHAIFSLSLIGATASLTSLAILPVCFATGLYAAMRAPDRLPAGWRSGIWRRALLAQFASYLTVAITTFLLLAFLPTQRHSSFVVNVIGLLPVFFGMLIMMWTWPELSRAR